MIKHAKFVDVVEGSGHTTGYSQDEKQRLYLSATRARYIIAALRFYRDYLIRAPWPVCEDTQSTQLYLEKLAEDVRVLQSEDYVTEAEFEKLWAERTAQ